MTGTWDMNINEGADFSVTLTWQAGDPLAAVDLTGWTAHLQIRNTYADNGGAIYADLTSSGSGITLGGSAGTITIFLPAATTATLGFASAIYDLKMTSTGGAVTRLIQGTVYLSQEVTT